MRLNLDEKGFLDGSVVKNLMSCQYRGQGFDPWSEKIPHALEQLSLCNY